MAGNVTRMLILGVVSLFEPVNGYQIRRELLSWKVDEWAHVNPGSIYHGLTSLAKHGFVERHDLVDAGRAVAVYEITDDGRHELADLLVDGLESVSMVDRAAFSSAFGLYPLIPRDQAVRSLIKRRVALEQLVADFAVSNDDRGAPPHAVRSVMLWLDLAITELAWLRETIEMIQDGALPSDLSNWAPLPDDPGWQMDADRKKYLSLLGR